MTVRTGMIDTQSRYRKWIKSKTMIKSKTGKLLLSPDPLLHSVEEREISLRGSMDEIARQFSLRTVPHLVAAEVTRLTFFPREQRSSRDEIL